MAKYVRAKSGHSLFVSTMTAEEFDALELQWGDASKYTHFYEVQNWDSNGVVFFYMAKGYHDGHVKKTAANEIHVWYPTTGRMWSSMGKNFEEAINGAQADGWMYA